MLCLSLHINHLIFSFQTVKIRDRISLSPSNREVYKSVESMCFRKNDTTQSSKGSWVLEVKSGVLSPMLMLTFVIIPTTLIAIAI